MFCGRMYAHQEALLGPSIVQRIRVQVEFSFLWVYMDKPPFEYPSKEVFAELLKTVQHSELVARYLLTKRNAFRIQGEKEGLRVLDWAHSEVARDKGRCNHTAW